MKQKKVYVCFDFDKDRSLKTLLIGQSRNTESPFVVTDRSLKEAAPEDGWEEKAREHIRNADRVIVLVGTDTHRAPGVLKEVEIARELGKKIVQVIGYKEGGHKRVPGAGILYKWTWDNLKKILG